MATMTYRFPSRAPAPPPLDTRPRIAVFGAAGATGQLAVRCALAAGHRVTAVLVEPTLWALAHEGLAIVHADPLLPCSLQGLLEGHDAVLCLVGHKPEAWHERESRRRVVPRAALATRHVVAAMSEAGVSRLVLMGSAGVGNSVAAGVLGLGHCLQWLMPEVMADRERQEALVRGSALRWTVLRPARLSHAPAGGVLHVGENLRWGWRGIPREDLAALMVRLVDDPSAIGKVLTVA
ncbi:NAD(P)-dependent oxidoreductase [uncultured Piscinibacter sp.]|uniref:NAD(P)-dependent oxidoreductase n=1 Tax=uncultured Piscinibacter sp. TaxID=1131835 RepID=UPI00260B69C3|nr:NAD(P)-binding oxidoreductase [uncultured Piscinibacter sp.]